MANSPLFSDETATDRAYINIRCAKNAETKEIKAHCEALWELFEPYADPNFLVELRSNFDARYWEMYLGAYFIEHGFEVDAPKPGPDLGIRYGGSRIWFEAVSPTRGENGHPDQVPEIKSAGTVHDAPAEKIILRYLNSISEKYRQRSKWIKDGTISDKDAFVIALNPHRIGFEHADSTPPRILQAAFTLGRPYVVMNRDTLDVVRTGYQFRNEVPKASGVAVTSGVFQQKDSAALSGLLCSRVDAANRPALTGSDFQLVANPHAIVSLPGSFRLNGTYFNVSEAEGGYDVKIGSSVGVRGKAET